MRSKRNYGRPAILAISIAWAACYNPHVNGTTAAANRRVCERNWVAVVNNTTYRIYDLYVGSRLVGSAEPRTTSRTTIDPALGLVTPTLRESPTTRDQKGARIQPGAVTMVCE